MDKRIKIKNIEIITPEETKFLSENEIKRFCKKKLRINITESVNDIHTSLSTKSGRVVLDRKSFFEKESKNHEVN